MQARHAVAFRLQITGTTCSSDARRTGVQVYLTDEVFLYRVVHTVASSHGYVVLLEDCYGLDVARVPMTVLLDRGLRVVTPTPPLDRARDHEPRDRPSHHSATVVHATRSQARDRLKRDWMLLQQPVE